MSTKWFLIIFVLLGMLLIGGCTMPSPCFDAEIGIAGNLAPSDFALASLSPSLTWEYPSTSPSPYPYPAGSSDCEINGYEIFLVSYIYPTSNIGGGVSGASSTSYTPRSPLQPSTLYYWQVRAMSSSGAGPWSGRRAFWTGPLCSPASLTAPGAIRPHGTVTTLRPRFEWTGGLPLDRSCMPGGYHFELSTEASFASTVASIDADLSPRELRWTPETDLEDCTDYYWRVAATNGSVPGPVVNASFHTAVGACPLTFVFIPNTIGNCRVGPDVLYDKLGLLTPDERFTVLARYSSAGRSWYNLQLPNNISCWASEVTGVFEGDPDLVPISTNFPPLPEKKPTGEPDGSEEPVCAGLSQNVCSVTPGCSYIIQSKTCVAN